METTMIFNKTVNGYKHSSKNLPCEDYSFSYSDEFGEYNIFIVADGHGDKSCFRSSLGSKFVVEVALEQLKAFANCYLMDKELYRNKLFSLRERSALIKVLTNAIISNWYEKVNLDLSINPITDIELSSCGDIASIYRNNEKLEHIYGTTLMAGIHIDNFIILLHQGDGRCVVLYKNGEIEQPIPWDERCYENVTTSMCDEDVSLRIRHTVINLNEKEVSACYLGTDGVEDSFRTMQGTNCFYRQLSLDLLDHNFVECDEFLTAKFEELSRVGSADDVSVSGILFKDSLTNIADVLKRNVYEYNLMENRGNYQRKLESMERKHRHLGKRYEEEKEKLVLSELNLNEITHQIETFEFRITELDNQILELSELLSTEKNKEVPLSYIKKISDFLFKKTDSISLLTEQRDSCNESLQMLAIQKEELNKEYNEKLESYSRVEAEFNEYDELYKHFEDKIKEIDMILSKDNIKSMGGNDDE